MSRPNPPLGRARDRTNGAARGDEPEPRLRIFERYLAGALQSRCRAPGALGDAIRYAALSPGKRLRPALVFAACEAVGGAWKKALPAAAAVEVVHAFSLVHDDLPAMDDDDLRRGLPTVHRKFGEAIAILAGDALLAFAFQELTALTRAGVRAERVVAAVEVLSRASGGEQLIAGQALDLAAVGRRVEENELSEIHLRKTGALFEASLALGGIVGGASLARLSALATAGRHLGLAFQIRDDLLDSDPVPNDGRQRSEAEASYATSLGVGPARVRAEAHLDLARAILEEYRLLSPSLAWWVERTIARDR